jgi:hypothetical protein
MRVRIIEELNVDPAVVNQIKQKYGEEFFQALNNTPGINITQNGIEMDISRYQKPEQHGVPSIRKAVFYLPEKNSPYKKYYSTGKLGYGGGEKVVGRTTFKNPMIIKAGTGGNGPARAYEKLKGKGSYDNIHHILIQTFSQGPMYQTSETKEKNITKVLTKLGGTPELAHDIVKYSNVGNTLFTATKENIIAQTIRNAGYDAVISYSKAQGQPRLSEVFDIRAFDYPTPQQKDYSYQDFYKERNIQPQFL